MGQFWCIQKPCRAALDLSIGDEESVEHLEGREISGRTSDGYDPFKGPQIGDDVLYLTALIEACAGHQPVGSFQCKNVDNCFPAQLGLDIEALLCFCDIDILERELQTGLFSPEIRSIKSTGFNQQMCADAAYIRGLPFEILAKRNAGMKK